MSCAVVTHRGILKAICGWAGTVFVIRIYSSRVACVGRGALTTRMRT